MPLVVEPGRERIPRDLALLALSSTELLVRGIGSDAIEPTAECRLALERVDLSRRRPERVLHDLLRVLLVARDPDGEPVHLVSIRGDERLGCVDIMTPKRLHEPRVPIGLWSCRRIRRRLSRRPLQRRGIHLRLPFAGPAGAP